MLYFEIVHYRRPGDPANLYSFRCNVMLRANEST